MPGEITAEPLYEIEEGVTPSFLERRRQVRDAVRRALPHLGLLHLRMPDWECSWGWSAARGSGVKVLVEVLGDWETAALYSRRRLPPLVRRLLARWARHRAQQIIAGGDILCFHGAALRDKYSGGRPSHLVTSHTIPEAEFRHREDTCHGEKVHLLFVASLEPYKGPTVLVRAVEALRAAGHPVHLDIVGDGSQRESVVALRDQLGLRDCITLHGYVTHGPALWDFFRRADIFVLPSLGAEGVPRVTQHAMAQCCPVVATDVGGLRDQLGDGSFGAVVPPGDSAALAAAIERLITDPDHRRAQIARAFEEASHHSQERQVEQCRDVLMGSVDPALLVDAPAVGSST
jgi:glycosyltransferase involved in cell wall biosynthesis